MTPEEKFKFDLEGYLVIKNVLSPGEVAALNDVADRVYPRNYDDDSEEFQGRKGLRRTSKVSAWSLETQALIDHPNVVPYLIALLGPKFRIDHDYCIFMQDCPHGGNLHGGPGGHLGSQRKYLFINGEMLNGLMVLTYFLSDAKVGDGGFACIPGSHKTHCQEHLPGDVKRFERIPDYVVQPEVEAGDALIFTEALVHGTMPWTADHERRTFLYKYTPGNLVHSLNYYDPAEYSNLTEQQKRVLSPPSSGGRPNVVEEA